MEPVTSHHTLRFGGYKQSGTHCWLLAFLANGAPSPAPLPWVLSRTTGDQGMPNCQMSGRGPSLQRDAAVLGTHNSAAPEIHAPTLLRLEITLGFYSSHP